MNTPQETTPLRAKNYQPATPFDLLLNKQLNDVVLTMREVVRELQQLRAAVARLEGVKDE